ncbi:MAG: putative sugar nucleotidyl transferase, partial [Lutibacter sp.]|nr:putative sugar nucleotidyl transferase [Lutibacter sp.]
MNYILYDGNVRTALLPLTYTKPVAALRIGILTIREKWEHYLKTTTSIHTEVYLEAKFPLVEKPENVRINASFLPNKSLVDQVKNLSANQAIVYGEEIIAFYAAAKQPVDFDTYEKVHCEEDPLQIRHVYDLFSLNARVLKDDFALLTAGKSSQPIPEGVRCVNKEQIFI